MSGLQDRQGSAIPSLMVLFWNLVEIQLRAERWGRALSCSTKERKKENKFAIQFLDTLPNVGTATLLDLAIPGFITCTAYY